MNSGTGNSVAKRIWIYDSRNFNELGNDKRRIVFFESTTVEISMNSGTPIDSDYPLHLRQ